MTIKVPKRHEQVAAKVFGWVRNLDTTWAAGDGTAHYIARCDWNPFERVEDDYMVLNRVRATWGLDDRMSFGCELVAKCSDRLKPDERYLPPQKYAKLLPLNYQVGDYAQAALDVLEKKGKKK